MSFCRGGSVTFDKKKFDDPTQLIVTLKVTQLVGIVSLMYGMLLHADAPARGDNPPPPLPQHTLTIATMGFRMLNHIAQLDLQLLQVILHRIFVKDCKDQRQLMKCVFKISYRFSEVAIPEIEG